MWRFYRPPLKSFSKKPPFQYIICEGFTSSTIAGFWMESIFQYIICEGFTDHCHSGSGWLVRFQYIICEGFTPLKNVSTRLGHTFQYIICEGFTPFIALARQTYFNTSYVKVLPREAPQRPILILNFNTSYVKVLPFPVSRMCMNVSISIHHMWRFYSLKINLSVSFKLFQYIICEGFTRLGGKAGFAFLHFNTSYVKVLLGCQRWLSKLQSDFNTSYVKVLRHLENAHNFCFF